MARTPKWARRLQDSLDALHRKVSSPMALDFNTLGRILAGAASVVQQALDGAAREKVLVAERDAYKQAAEAAGADLDEVRATLESERAADASEDAAYESRIAEGDAANAEANAKLTEAANALDALLKGPETPVVVTPAPEEAVDVIEGNTEPEVISEEPAANDEVLPSDPAVSDGGTVADGPGDTPAGEPANDTPNNTV